MAFGERLKEMREARGWTQQQLAAAAGLTRDGIAQLEGGRRSPAWDTVLSLCDALSISCDAFRRPGEGSTAPDTKKGRRTPPATPSVPPAEDLEAAKKKPKSKRSQ